LNVAAGIGAFGFGNVDDRFGGKRTILWSLAGLSAATLIAVWAPTAAWLWVAGVLVGVFAGPNQSASRSLLGRFVPPSKETEFYGLFAFSGKLTAFMGPLLLGAVTDWTGSQRWGVAMVLPFFLLGAWVLWGLDEQAGIATAEPHTDAQS